MKLYLVKPDLTYFNQYNQMMEEWCKSKTQIAPWFLDEPIEKIEDFAKFIQKLDNCEKGFVDPKFCATTSYFVVDENDRLIGATSYRHYLTFAGFNSWGHIGYGVRPSERRKGYATQMLKMMLQVAKENKIFKVLIGVHEGNIGSWKTVEKCGGVLENKVNIPDAPELIRRYWITIPKD